MFVCTYIFLSNGDTILCLPFTTRRSRSFVASFRRQMALFGRTVRGRGTRAVVGRSPTERRPTGTYAYAFRTRTERGAIGRRRFRVRSTRTRWIGSGRVAGGHLHGIHGTGGRKYGSEPPQRSCLKLMSKENLQALVMLGFRSR